MPYFVDKLPNFPATAGEAIGTCQLVAISNVDGQAYLACAGAGIEELPALGVAETAVAAGEVVEVKHRGQVDLANGLWPGDLVYTSNTAGAISLLAIHPKAWDLQLARPSGLFVLSRLQPRPM